MDLRRRESLRARSVKEWSTEDVLARGNNICEDRSDKGMKT